MAVIDLGLGHRLTPVHDKSDVLIGWMHHHTAPDGFPCVSFCAITTGYGAPAHKVEEQDPLTLSPSLQCRACGAHGFVLAGRWSYVS